MKAMIMTQNYLLKRSPDIIDGASFDFYLTKSWYADVKINAIPSYSNDLQKGDKIYIAESGYAIYSKGILDEIVLHEFEAMDQFVEYCLYNAKTDHERFWYMKLQKYYERRDDFKKICVREIKIRDQEILEVPHILQEEFLQRRSWYELDTDFKLEDVPAVNEGFTKYIPTKIRKKVYHRYKIRANGHIVDIDHHVPRSVGGPGNIEENLIPISSAINRSKSDNIPSKLFDFAERYNIEAPKDSSFKHDSYLRDGKSRSIAKQIVSKINNENFETAKSIYRDIKLAHFPNLST